MAEPIASAPAKAAVGTYGEFRTGWPVVLSAIVGIGLGLSPLPFYTLGLLGPELERAFAWPKAAVQGGLLVMMMAVLVASPAVGWLADRYGVRRVALASLGLFGLAFASFGLNPGSLPLYYFTWGAIAVLGAGTLPVTWTRAVNNRFEQRKGLALGLSLLGTGLFGFISQPLLRTLIGDSHNWRLAYWVLGALPLLIALPVAWFGFHDAGPRKQSSAERRRSDNDRTAATPGLSFGETVRSWRFWVIGLAFVPISFAVGGPIPNMPSILKLNGFGPAEIVSLTQIIGLTVIAGRIIGGWLIDRFWAPAVALILLSLPAVACWLLAKGGFSYGTAALANTLIGFAAGVEYDLLAFLVARYFGMKSYGKIYGTLYGFFAFGAGLGPVVFGLVFDRTKSFSGALLLCGGLYVAGAVLLLSLGRYRRFEQPSAAGVLARAEMTADAHPA